ncbi:hypothetical protein Tco_1228299 [Tanacetum coccineum]
MNLKNWKWEDVIVIVDVDVPNKVGERNNNVELKEEYVTVDVQNQHDVQSDDDVPLAPIKRSKKHHIKITARNRLYCLFDSEDDEDKTENLVDEVVDEDEGEDEVVREDEVDDEDEWP